MIITLDNGYTSNGMNTAISFGSDTHINAGVIELQNGNGLGDGTFAHTVVVASGAALELSGNITFPSGLTLDLSGSGIGGTGALHTIGAGSFASTVAGPVILESPAADIGVDGTGTTTVSGLVSGSGALVKVGTGTLVLSDASNTYGGGTTISAGTLSITSDGDLGAVPGRTQHEYRPRRRHACSHHQ